MNYNEFKEAVIRYATANKIDEYELYYSQSEDLDVTVYKTEVKGFQTSDTMGACFRCIINGKMGYASTENFTDEEAASIVNRAIENAKSIEAEEKVFIHESGDTYATVDKEEFDLFDANKAVETALELQKKVYATDERVQDGTQSASGYGKSKTAIYNSKGLDLYNETQFSFAYSVPIVACGDERFNGMDASAGDYKKFDLDAMAKEAVDDALSYEGYTGIDSGKYDMVISSKVMYTFLSTFSSIFSANSAQKGMSLLAGKEGSEVAANIVSLVDDPMYKEAISKRTFDAEGVATYKKDVIREGKLVTLLHNLKTANVAGIKSTGNASKGSYDSPIGIGYYSFYIEPGKGTKEELMKQVNNGIYLTSITGLHAGANAVTGEFSLSSEGFIIKDGVKSTPIKNFTVAGNFYDLLKNITVVGEELKFSKFALGSARAGSPDVIVPGITVAGK